MMNTKIIVLLVTLSPLLISCGTKGSLYIPEERYPQNESSNQLININTLNHQIT